MVEFLSGHQYQVDYADNGTLGEHLALSNIYDVILLDLNLPDIDGLDLCTQIKSKANYNPPILMLTARDSFKDKAAGFHQGADDYLTKPFDLRELPLRCEALARRHNLHRSKVLTHGEITLDLDSKTATRKGQPLSLTGIGFKILKILIDAHPQPVSRSMLIHKLWGDFPPASDALKSHIYALRKSLDKPYYKPLLTTLNHIGFKLERSKTDDTNTND
ncbi:response regulator transcription factor [Thalassotalea litorea]|uniref:Response regulator transcription factor n=2 Tax=Thalassotalea litorea TaxID=2020715 RepID=A0A5R9IBQ9_9GAMM|nr:response regulator transcription factor [Thalassotalea litorea]